MPDRLFARTFTPFAMLLPLLFASTALAQPPSGIAAESGSAAEGDDIAVVGQKLRRAGGVIGINPITGKMKCRITHPSGAERIDAAACDIGLRCVKQFRRDRDRATACVEEGYEAFLKTYFDG